MHLLVICKHRTSHSVSSERRFQGGKTFILLHISTPSKFQCRRCQTSNSLVTYPTLNIGVQFGRICEEKVLGILKADFHSILRRNS
jgi:hypothetical protein